MDTFQAAAVVQERLSADWLCTSSSGPNHAFFVFRCGDGTRHDEVRRDFTDHNHQRPAAR
jgi:hypothetical protein